MKEYGVIYMLINKINGKCYIGQSIDFNDRISKYKNLKCKFQRKLFNAFKKYGFNNFDVDILQKAKDKDELNELEKFYIQYFNTIENGYNLKSGGSEILYSKESKEKMSKSHVGKTSGMLGKKHSQETKDNHSKRMKGKNHPLFGKVHPRAKSILCHQNKKIYNSAKDASKDLNIQRGSIWHQINNKFKYVGDKFGNKYTFEYINE